MLIVRDHMLAGRQFGSLDELDAASAERCRIRRGSGPLHHGQVVTTWAPVGALPAGEASSPSAPTTLPGTRAAPLAATCASTLAAVQV